MSNVYTNKFIQILLIVTIDDCSIIAEGVVNRL